MLAVIMAATMTTPMMSGAALLPASRGVLRLDYALSGCAGARPEISLARTLSQPDRHVDLSGRVRRLPLRGNGMVSVVDPVCGDTLYRQSFSTLFQEWLQTGDSTRRTFESSVIIPVPDSRVKVALQLTDERGRVMASHSAWIDPSDILIRPVRSPGYDTVWINRATYPGRHIGVAILAEGYTDSEMDRFEQRAREAAEALFEHEPFAKYNDRFDVVAVKSPSAQSGVSVPKDSIWRDNAFGSHFSTFYSDRYLTSPRVYDIQDALSGVPCEHIIILANEKTYGGGGIFNSYTLTAADNEQFRPVVVHEFGHSFGGLGDEYFYDNDVMTDTYPRDVEPWEPNVTTLVDFDSKWADMIDRDTPIPTPVSAPGEITPSVGVFEGAAYSSKGIYRPADYCRMRVNNIDHFCPVCRRAIERLILYYTE